MCRTNVVFWDVTAPGSPQLDFLLQRGVDPNLKTSADESALVNAAKYGYGSCVGLLLDAKADINQTNGKGETAFHVRNASRTIPPRWVSIRFSLALRTYAPCGPSVRVVSQTKSRKLPSRNVEFTGSFFL